MASNVNACVEFSIFSLTSFRCFMRKLKRAKTREKEEENLTFTFHFTNEIITVCLCKQFHIFIFLCTLYLVREAVYDRLC